MHKRLQWSRLESSQSGHYKYEFQRYQHHFWRHGYRLVLTARPRARQARRRLLTGPATIMLGSAQVATNIATAVNANTTVNAVLTATANSPASGDVLLTAKTAGPAGNSYAVSESGFSAFTPASGNLSGGAAATVQPNTYPAKYSFSTTSASCSDFVVYPTGQAGSSGAANIIAYDNLYATGTGAPCSTGPSVYWAYNTGGTVTTSPILSYSDNGTQVAFMQVERHDGEPGSAQVGGFRRISHLAHHPNEPVVGFQLSVVYGSLHV